ncbi:MAG TPA: TetR/AcrR family transcriptional regulator [Acidimicrobiales bacterium]
MTGDEAVADGRHRRRARNRDAVVEAILGLLDEGVARPTAQDIAARAGVSMRSIFRLFDDMEALHRAAIERQTARIEALLVEPPTDGPLADRIAAVTDNRAEVFEAISPARRLANRLAPTSPAIAGELARFGRYLRRQLATTFAPELGRPGADALLLDALDAATSWDAWERLRVNQGLGPDDARRTVTLTVTALLREGP